MKVHKSAAAAVFFILMSFLLSAVIPAQSQRPSEYEVKAAYLLNFLKFVQWPNSTAGSDNTISICVLGHDPFGVALDRIVSGQQIDGKNVVTRRIDRALDVNGCRVLFIDASESGQLASTIMALDDLPVLTVSEMPDFVSRGGIIQFLLKEGRVRFEVNLMRAQRIGLMMSSQMLNVASAVKR